MGPVETVKSIFNIFLISNKDLLISKKETPKYTGSTWVYNQLQKLHKSIFNILDRASLLRLPLWIMSPFAEE